MNYTNPITFTSLEEIKNNFSFYKDKFYNDGILVLRDANLNYEDQEKLWFIFGQGLGFYPNDPSHFTDPYTENHSRLNDNSLTNSRLKKIDKDNPIIAWHIENAFFDNPVVAAIWNMTTFELDEDCGNTWFVDAISLIESLPKDDQLFLEKCIIKHSNTVLERKYDERLDRFLNEKIPVVNETLKKHWLHDKYTLRMYFEEDGEGLYSVAGQKPTEEEIIRYKKLRAHIIQQVKENKEIRIVHRWKQGDLVIPDLHRMVHTVGGGIEPSKRQFTGIWAYQYNRSEKEQFDADTRLSIKYPF